MQLPVEGLHDLLERAGLGHAVAEMADGVLIGRAIAEREPQEAHPTQAIADHELGTGIGQVVLGLQDQDLEHGHWIEWRPAALAAIAVTKPLDQPGPEILKIHRLPQNLERIAMLAQSFKVIVQAEKRMRVLDDAP